MKSGGYIYLDASRLGIYPPLVTPLRGMVVNYTQVITISCNWLVICRSINFSKVTSSGENPAAFWNFQVRKCRATGLLLGWFLPKLMQSLASLKACLTDINMVVYRWRVHWTMLSKFLKLSLSIEPNTKFIEHMDGLSYNGQPVTFFYKFFLNSGMKMPVFYCHVPPYSFYNSIKQHQIQLTVLISKVLFFLA